VSPSRPAIATSRKAAAPAVRAPKTLTAVPLSTAVSQSAAPLATSPRRPDWRLHKHADYQRVYQASRKHAASLMTYFVAPQPAEQATAGPRIGITAGKVLGKAVERNRIKRRMRAAITANLDALPANVDVVLHPRRAVLNAQWTVLGNEVRRIFVKIQQERTS
jgi:ribonuclease P protein component